MNKYEKIPIPFHSWNEKVHERTAIGEEDAQLIKMEFNTINSIE